MPLCTLRFRVRDGELALRYRLLEHSSALRWRRQLRRALRWGGRPQCNWILHEDEGTLPRRLERLDSLKRELAALGVPEAADEHGIPPDRAELNRLHGIFARRGASPGAPAQLHELNRLVHWLERAMTPADRRPAEHAVVSVSGGLPWPAALLEPEEHMARTLDCEGGLYLGYGRIGKTLYHCSLDDDLDTVRARAVAPAELITPEFVAVFRVGRRRLEHAANERRFYEWCRRAEVERWGYDCREPRHRPGMITLGRLESPGSIEDARDRLDESSELLGVELDG